MNLNGYKTVGSISSQQEEYPKAQSEIEYSIEKLKSALERLEYKEPLLKEKLSLVIKHIPKNEQTALVNEQSRAVYSLLAQAILEAAYRIDTVSDKLNVLTDDLSL